MEGSSISRWVAVRRGMSLTGPAYITIELNDGPADLKSIRFSFVKHLLTADLEFGDGVVQVELDTDWLCVDWFKWCAELGRYILHLKYRGRKKPFASYLVRRVGGFMDIADNIARMLTRPGSERDAYSEPAKLSEAETLKVT
jgi:hypothetical protein